MIGHVVWFAIGFVVGGTACFAVFKEEAAIYDRLVEALQKGEAYWFVEVAKVKSELEKLHL